MLSEVIEFDGRRGRSRGALVERRDV